MAAPPEKINIRRRKRDNSVDFLVLDQGQQKRRFTDFYFQRVKDDKEILSGLPAVTRPQIQAKKAASTGIPSVRATAPGDEIKDYARYQNAQKALDKAQSPDTAPKSTITTTPESKLSQHGPASDTAPATPVPRNARRFHLTRNLTSPLSPNQSGGIRKPKINLRPPIATFIERNSARFETKDHTIHRTTPIDKILASAKSSTRETVENSTNDSQGLPDEHTKRVGTQTFLKPLSSNSRRGQSIVDHPSTWDRDSDTLADQLAALAFELDPVGTPPATSAKSTPSKTVLADSKMMDTTHHDDDYVYETFIRVKHVASDITNLWQEAANVVGVLVIDEEEEELWETYIHEDDDSDWDEEDPDSNAEDNPANDYPEDDVSDDDEFGNHAYKYRTYGSDQEEYGDEYD